MKKVSTKIFNISKYSQDTIKSYSIRIMMYTVLLTNFLYLIFFTLQKSQILSFILFILLVANVFISIVNMDNKDYLLSAIITTELSVIGFILNLFLGWETDSKWFIILGVIPHYLIYETKVSRRNIITFLSYLIFIISYFLNGSLKHLATQVNTRLYTIITMNLVFGILILEILMVDLVNKALKGLFLNQILKMEDKVQKDQLTGLLNRYYAENYFKQLDSEQAKFCVAILDIDFFKKINDDFDHATGDKAIIFLANILKTYFRASDTVIRWGGEEFIVILRDVELSQAYAIFENLREKVESTPFNIEGTQIKMTITIGLSESEKDKKISEIIIKSDRYLIFGKKQGRNLVVTSEIIKKCLEKKNKE